MALDPVVQEVVDFLNTEVAQQIREAGYEPGRVDDLLTGAVGCEDSCPIAHTILSMLPSRTRGYYVSISGTYIEVEDTDALGLIDLDAPPCVSRFVEDFDAGRGFHEYASDFDPDYVATVTALDEAPY